MLNSIYFFLETNTNFTLKFRCRNALFILFAFIIVVYFSCFWHLFLHYLLSMLCLVLFLLLSYTSVAPTSFTFFSISIFTSKFRLQMIKAFFVKLNLNYSLENFVWIAFIVIYCIFSF